MVAGNKKYIKLIIAKTICYGLYPSLILSSKNNYPIILKNNVKSNNFIAKNTNYPETFDFNDDLLSKLYLSIQ